MDHLIDNIKKYWLKWESVPFVFAIVMMFYVGLASEVNDWTGIVMGAMEYLLLALPFAAVVLIYVLCCAVHRHRQKKKEAQEPSLPKEKSAARTIWLVTGLGVAVLAVVLALLFFISGIDRRDGSYVIWADKYGVTLTAKVHKSYYLEGADVRVLDGEPSDYPAQSVAELVFCEDGSFTISVGGHLLGVTPEKNGVGYSSSCTGIHWELEEVEEGVYYIRNVEENTYLKWYDHMKNWTTHPNIVEENQDQYLMRLVKVEGKGAKG